MANRRNKDALYEQLARLGKAVSAPRRLELLDLLAQAPRTVEALAHEAEMSIANTSQHLQLLRAAGLVESDKEGLYVTYRLATADVSAFVLGLQRLGEARLDELQAIKKRFFGRTDDLTSLGASELARLVERGEVVLLDVRPREEFEAGHLDGAVSIPHRELVRRLRELPKDRPVVAYCRGPYCVFAATAVKELRARGFDATRAEHSVAEWKALGFPVARGEQEREAR